MASSTAVEPEPHLIQSRRSRTTGTTVEVWRNFDYQPGYQTICVEHGGICEHETRRYATDWAPVPDQWCPGCQGDA